MSAPDVSPLAKLLLKHRMGRIQQFGGGNAFISCDCGWDTRNAELPNPMSAMESWARHVESIIEALRVESPPPVPDVEPLRALIAAAKNWCPVCRGNGWLRGPTTTKCPNCYVLFLRADDALNALGASKGTTE